MNEWFEVEKANFDTFLKEFIEMSLKWYLYAFKEIGYIWMNEKTCKIFQTLLTFPNLFIWF